MAARDFTQAGSIELIIGPMFSEKTTELLSRVRRAALANQPALVVKYADDCRYEEGDVVATHGGIRQASEDATSSCAGVRIVRAHELSDVAVADEERIVAVDEGQFYPDLVEACVGWAEKGRRVIVSALDGDFARRPFGRVCDLVPLCELVEKRQGVCMVCRRQNSSFSQRIGSDMCTVQIGASEKYRGVCRSCYAGKPAAST
jgi:thymidine kinase